MSVNGIKPISPEQEELIHRLVYFQSEYEHPSEEDVKRIMVCWLSNSVKGTPSLNANSKEVGLIVGDF